MKSEIRKSRCIEELDQKKASVTDFEDGGRHVIKNTGVSGWVTASKEAGPQSYKSKGPEFPCPQAD